MGSAEAVICGVCHKAEANHEGLNHKFSIEGILIPVDADAAKRMPPQRSMPDHVLRLALINRGLLTPDDLNKAAAELRGLTT